MSEEFGLTNAGDNIVPVPVEVKEPTIPAAELTKIPQPIEKKKRGRPAKRSLTPPQGVAEVAPVEEVVEKTDKEWYCSTCRETISDKNVMRIGAGDNGRCAVFCPQCQRSFGFEDKDLQDKVAALIKDNPTGKSAKA
jgi:hypothetical protein